ncbi:glycosyltransferase [Psychrobacter cryohalolentis]|uniref:glycosyltransferase n=1 Tax=Psychrobacter sp. D2 TaxID=2759702 RepID=UPI0015E5D515|nr:glycosyltransferase [Psychrobacter sp. D2]MBA2058331.1 glycosyltransferase [Psychrobacter sp. D2]
MKVFYFGFYTKNINPNDFVTFPGCNTKMSYIIDAIKENDIPIDVICLGESFKKATKKYMKIDDLEVNTFVSTVSNRVLSKINLWGQVSYYLLFKIKKEDTVIFYHSLYMLPVFKIAKAIKGFRLIIEVEESYYAAWGKSKLLINIELMLLRGAYGYIYVNDILPNLIEKNHPYVICYGGYNVSKKNFLSRNEKNSLKNLVYAGLISEEKGSDIYLAINAMSFLDNGYKLHVLGYGTDRAIDNLNAYISSESLSQKVHYEGFLTGDDYTAYLSNCDIALNPRMLLNELSNYTFPSKVLSYLCTGLLVVSTPIDCIKYSSVANLVSFSKDSTPSEFANAIKNIDYSVSPTDSVKKLHRDFVREIGVLLKK